jgi:TPR repeat protein
MRFGVIAFCFVLVLATACNSVAGSSFEKGKTAYDAKNYETAFQILLPHAEAGRAEAQLMVADMYNIGRGVAQDNAAAIMWYHEAAAQGNEQAIQMLGQGMRLLGESTD